MTFQEEQEALRVAWQDLWYSIFDAFGLIAVARRRRWQMRPWVLDAEERRAARDA